MGVHVHASYKDDKNGVIRGAGDTPDNQSYRHHIGDPRDKQAANDAHVEAANDPYYDWKKTGHVSGREFHKNVIGDLRRAGYSPRKRAIIEAAGEGFTDKDHGVSGLSRKEAIDFVGEVKEKANRLGLSKGDIQKLENAVKDAINE